MYDFEGYDQFKKWQKMLDDAGVDFQVTDLAGATFREINGYVNALIANAKRRSAK